MLFKYLALTLPCAATLVTSTRKPLEADLKETLNEDADDAHNQI